MNRFIKSHILLPILSKVSYFLRCIEVLLCIRKTPYKTHTFKKNPAAEYYYNKEKWRKPYY